MQDQCLDKSETILTLYTIGFMGICRFIFEKASFSKVFAPRCVSPNRSGLVELDRVYQHKEAAQSKSRLNQIYHTAHYHRPGF